MCRFFFESTLRLVMEIINIVALTYPKVQLHNLMRRQLQGLLSGSGIKFRFIVHSAATNLCCHMLQTRFHVSLGIEVVIYLIASIFYITILLKFATK